MLLPISGKRAKEEPRAQESKKAEKPVRATATRSKKAG
jgi:DNA end-binding protein Ku